MSLCIIILAAGQGARMYSDKPKVLHSLAGKPLLAHVFQTALSIDHREIFVVYGYGGEQVPEAMQAYPVSWVKQEEQMGTGKKEVQYDDKQALTKIFEDSKVEKTPEIVKQIVADIDDIVNKIRFEGWQFTIAGERQIKQEITRVLLKQKLHKEKELFEKAYDYIKQNY